MSEKALQPIEQKTIVFYDDEITAVIVNNNQGQVVFVPLRTLCNHLGIAYNAQRQRITAIRF